MKKVKFRRKEIKSNKYVDGFLIRCVDDCATVTSEGLKTDYLDSIVQFVGYDKNGNEIYSNDQIRFLQLQEISFDRKE